MFWFMGSALAYCRAVSQLSFFSAESVRPRSPISPDAREPRPDRRGRQRRGSRQRGSRSWSTSRGAADARGDVRSGWPWPPKSPTARTLRWSARLWIRSSTTDQRRGMDTARIRTVPPTCCRAHASCGPGRGDHGEPSADRYLLGLDPHAPDTHAPLASAMMQVDRTTLIGTRGSHPALRISGQHPGCRAW